MLKVRITFELILCCLLSSILHASTNCPSDCECKVATFSCSQCLHNHFRTYNSSTKACDCLTGFREMLPVQSSCCPTNCSTCSYYGCYSCRKNWKIDINYRTLAVVCVCIQNFIFNGTDCTCMAGANPTEYYYIKSEDVCLKCPHGCTCNHSGCVSCNSSTQRVITKDGSQNRNKCECQPPYVDVEGFCVCTKLCNCFNGTTICSRNITHRFQNLYTNIWECIPPYEQGEGICKCPVNYVQASMLNDTYTKACVCLSRQLPKYYFYFEGACEECYFGCRCNERGCYYCQAWTNRVPLGGGCWCRAPFVQGHGIGCDCVQPYYPLNASTCVCLSNINSTGYVYDNLTNSCYKCPDNCSCDNTGCFKCNASANRIVTQMADGHYSCAKCIYSAELVDDECQCEADGMLSEYSRAGGTCGCVDDDDVYSDFLDNGKCTECPIGCNCSSSQGCFQCDPRTNRIIITNSSNYSSCPCMLGTVMRRNSLCVCLDSYDTYTVFCSCSTPYYLVDGVCKCLSEVNPTLYYFDNFEGICYNCPPGCRCNETGCYSCQPDSLRYNYVNRSYSYCRCVQDAFLINGECVKCKEGQYYMSGECIRCPTCRTCNKFGCTSCSNGMDLIDNECVCQNQMYVNVYGLCRCAPGTYQENTSSPCVACPAYCEDCEYVNSTVSCIICPSTPTRQNDPANNCPCVFGYKQAGITQSFCCSSYCSTCNETGCTSCPRQTYRFLTQDQDCACPIGLLDSLYTVSCVCPVGYFIYLGKCYICPLNCQTCYYQSSTATTKCFSCLSGVNRNQDSTCSCLTNFHQSKPLLPYCIPNYCLLPEINCTKCFPYMQPLNNGTACICMSGYYMTQYYVCAPCAITGCKNCSSATFCNYCDEAKGYYLTDGDCAHDMNSTQYIYVQTQKGIIVEFVADVNLTIYEQLEEVSGRIVRVMSRLQNNSVVEEPVDLKTVNASIRRPNVIGVLFESPEKRYIDYNYTLQISYVVAYYPKPSRRFLGYWIDVDDQGTPYRGYDATVYIRREIFYSDYDTEVNNKGQYGVEYALTVVIMVVAMAIYVKGYKHNQIPFYLQTLSFLGLTVEDKKFHMTAYLYNLRWSYYDLGNAISGIIPDWYLQSSKANFAFYTIDSNILRTCGTTILFALINCAVIIILRALYFLYNNTPMKNSPRISIFVGTNKKPIYRLLQFMYKTTMYPLLFFSFITYHDWHARVLVDKHGFHHFSHILAIAYLIIYFCVTLYQFYMETTAKITKLENVSEFVFDVLAAMIVTVSMGDKSYIALIAVFIPRGIVYLLIRRMLLRDFQAVEYLKLLSVTLEVITILLVLTKSAAALVVMTILTVIVQLGHEVAVVFLTEKQALINKKMEPDSVTVSSSSASTHAVTKFTDEAEG